ncbi:hypothetical protein BKA80DRAFT_258732 [Phyllosticta citrichinensis]
MLSSLFSRAALLSPDTTTGLGQARRARAHVKAVTTVEAQGRCPATTRTRKFCPSSLRHRPSVGRPGPGGFSVRAPRP